MKTSHSASYNQYMARVQTESIPCYEPVIGEQELENLTEVIRSGWLSERTYTRQFEEELGRLCERPHAIACSNATAGMIAGMRSLGLRAGNEIIVPSLSHPADPNAVVAAGAIPVFAEVDEKTLCLSVETITTALTPKTRAILLVAAYGNAPDLEEMSSFARQHDLFLIVDSAAALGSLYRGKPVASFGDFAVLSFFADKTITTGEGGMFLTDDEKLAAEFMLYKHDGRAERGNDTIERAGYNFRITELQSALGVAQLTRLPGFITRKRELLARYREALSDIPAVEVFDFHPDVMPVPHRIIIFVPDAQLLMAHLSKRGIGVRTLFPPMHRQPAYDVTSIFPVTERLFETGVCLPSAPTLTDEQVGFIAGEIRKFYGA